jgi:hypothetical protein
MERNHLKKKVLSKMDGKNSLKKVNTTLFDLFIEIVDTLSELSQESMIFFSKNSQE